MLIENVELNLNHVGLGNLNEVALLILFATAQAHLLIKNKRISLRDIVDKNEVALYPAYYMTHLTVPPNKLLESFGAWEPVSIGVEVRNYGGMLLDSIYVLSRSGDIPENSAAWGPKNFVGMQAGSMFVVNGRDREPQVATPKAEFIADLSKLSAPPGSMERFRKVRAEGAVIPRLDGNLTTGKPFLYPIVSGRDVAPGQAMMFATFVNIMDYAERRLLVDRLWPPFPKALADCRTVLERETYYFGNCYGDDVVQVSVTGALTECSPDFHGSRTDIISIGIFTFQFELYERSSNRLIAISKARKLMAVPSSQQSTLRDAERLLRGHAIDARKSAELMTKVASVR